MSSYGRAPGDSLYSSIQDHKKNSKDNNVKIFYSLTTFDTNAETHFDNEDIPAIRAHFADSARWRATTYGKTEPASLEDKVYGWTNAFAQYDFDLVTEDLRLLPGVNAQTGEPDGSVRVYFDWEAAIPATDSTERKAVTITYYESWDFDADGKIWLTQIFGDETAAMQALNGM